jgi:hypothetical protein
MNATQEQTRRWHIGIRESYDLKGLDANGNPHPCRGLPCPFDSITLAGVTFHKRTEHVTGWNAETRRQEVMGGYVELTPEQVAAVQADIGQKRIQFQSHDPDTKRPKVYEDDSTDPPRRYVKGRVITVGVKGVIPHATDTNIHGWLYMTPQEAPTVFEQQEPDSIAIQPSKPTSSGSDKRSRK